MSEISCLVLNITKLKKKNVFVASRNFYGTTCFTQIGPKVPRVININFTNINFTYFWFLPKHYQKKRLGEVIN